MFLNIGSYNSLSFEDKPYQCKYIQAYFLSNQPTVLTVEDSSILSKKIILSFYYHDSLYRGTPFVINKRITKLFLTRPTLICQADQNQTLYLVYPGEHINLKINKNNEIILLTDNNKQRNNELIFFKDLIQNYGKLYNFLPNKPYHFNVENVELVEEAGRFINNLKRLRLNFLDSFIKISPVSPNFRKLAFGVIESAALKDSLLLYWSNRELLMKKNLYEKFIDQKIETIKHIEFQPYLVYQGTVISLLSMMTTPYLSYELQSRSDFVKRFDGIQKNFDGILKDFLLANTMISMYNLSQAIPDSYITKFEHQCNDAFYKRAIMELLNSPKKVTAVEDFDKVVSADNKTIIDIGALISKHKGKVILIDFWASWCLPCREEFPASMHLENYFKGMDVVFIYLSTDRNLEEWKKSLQQEEMNSQDCFVFLDADKSTFLKKFNIVSIPRYFVIGKDGSIINSDAPRPSDTTLINILKKCLSN